MAAFGVTQFKRMHEARRTNLKKNGADTLLPALFHLASLEVFAVDALEFLVCLSAFSAIEGVAFLPD